jgi:hypothetical protein
MNDCMDVWILSLEWEGTTDVLTKHCLQDTGLETLM